MSLDMQPVSHIEDTHTLFQISIILKSKSMCYVCAAFIEGWDSVYMGYPNRMRVDRESSIMAK